MQNNNIFSSSGAPIIISSPAPEKKNKSAIIIVVIILFIIVLAVVAVIMIGQNNKNQNQVSVNNTITLDGVPDSLKKTYSIYANYFLHGEDSDADFLENYKDTTIYYPLEIYDHSESEVASFYDKSISLLEDYMNEYEKYNPKSTIAKSYLKFHKSQLEKYKSTRNLIETEENTDNSLRNNLDSIDLLINQCFILRNDLKENKQ